MIVMPGDPLLKAYPNWEELLEMVWEGNFPTAVAEKQLPIDEESKARLTDLRINMFYDESNALAERMYTGEISLGQWEEAMKRLTRELHASVAAIGKGGWDAMDHADWGRLGPQMKDQYRYLHGFAEYVDANKDTVSLAAIQARARMYGNASRNSAYLLQAGEVLAKKLPWLPGDGSTKCLVNCQCRWELEIVDKEGDFNVVQATWHLGVAEHCHDCLERDGYMHTMKVHKTIAVPSVIGGF